VYIAKNSTTKVAHQFSRGQDIRCELALQISRQLHLHRTYFFPAGAGRIACNLKQWQ